jgi:hypothetical protein
MRTVLRALLAILFFTVSAEAQTTVRTVTADTELATAAALADNTANPTVTSNGVFGHAFDGSTWDRVTFGSAGTASAQVWTIQGIASMTPISANVFFGGSAAAVGAGAVSSTVQRFTLASDDPGVTLLTAISASADTIEGAVSGSLMQVNVAKIGNADPTTDLTFDMDSGAGTQTRGAIGIGVAASGGAVQITGDATNGLDVDVTRLPALVAGTANIGDVDVASIAAGDNNIGNVDVVTLPSVTIGTFPDNEPINIAQMNGVTVTMGNGASGTGVQRVTIANDSTGVVGLNAGDADIGNVDLEFAGTAASTNNGAAGAQTLRVTVANDSTGVITPIAATTGGCTPGSLLSANTVNETEIKDTGGQLYMLNVTNIGADEVFFKMYDVDNDDLDETDTPILRFVIPGNAAGAGNSVNVPAVGIVFSTAISFRITTGAADNSTGAVAASEVLVSYCYK